LSGEERIMPEIAHTSYGKTGIPVMKVVRKEPRHEVWEFVVDVTAESPELERAYTKADNSPVVATDTMKNLVNYLSFAYDFTSLEGLALHIGQSLQERYDHLPRWTIRIEGANWKHLAPGGDESPISFARTGPEASFTTAIVDGEESSLRSGVRDLLVLKTTDSAFSGFVRDEFTSLPEASDRMLATSITAEWKLPSSGIEHTEINHTVRETILRVFSELKSESVQHLAYETATAVLDSIEEVEEISLRLPNKHYFLMDLSPFGVENSDTLYLPTIAPHGDIQLQLTR
jgi:urate oxidase